MVTLVRTGGRLAAICTTAALAVAGCDPDPAPRAPVVRKSASAMTDAEVDRFVRAHEYAVAQGYFDVFNDEHYDHHRNRNHGADVLATSPMTAQFMETEWGYRLLPWHRAFLMEGEAMLQAALRERDAAEGRDPAEADELFIPYWDASVDQALPDWVLAFQPQGGSAIVPPDLPPGHAGYGKPVGSRYDIVFGRWPAGNLVFDTLPGPDYLGRILAKPDFVSFYNALDTEPELVPTNFARAQAGLATLDKLLPDDPAVDTLVAAFSAPPSGSGSDPETAQRTTNALFSIGHRAAVEVRRATPDTALVTAVEDVYSLFNFVPHLRLHLWAGGLAPDDANLRGTVTYFNELCVDPVFWMIHAELDRVWWTWQDTHDEAPPLTGDLAIFDPLTPEEGSWYGGGVSRTLDELVDRDGLGYGYDATFAPPHAHGH